MLPLRALCWGFEAGWSGDGPVSSSAGLVGRLVQPSRSVNKFNASRDTVSPNIRLQAYSQEAARPFLPSCWESSVLPVPHQVTWVLSSTGAGEKDNL